MNVKEAVFTPRHFLGGVGVGATVLATAKTFVSAANPTKRAMSHRERIEKALALEETDRLPFGFWWHFPNQDRSPRRLAQLSLELQQKLDLDFIKFSPYGLYSVVDWGVTLDVRGGKLPPVQAEYPVKKPEDWRKLKRLQGTEGEYLSYWRPNGSPCPICSQRHSARSDGVQSLDDRAEARWTRDPAEPPSRCSLGVMRVWRSLPRRPVVSPPRRCPRRRWPFLCQPDGQRGLPDASRVRRVCQEVRHGRAGGRQGPLLVQYPPSAWRESHVRRGG